MPNELRHKNVVAGEISENEYEAINQHIANNQVANDMLYYNGANWIRATATTIRGLLEHSIIFHVNAFQYPNPGTDWTPQLEGAHLSAGLAAKVCWLPLNFLKVGDIITTYNLLGDMVRAAATSLDCRLVRINLAHNPLTTTNIVNGAIVTIAADGAFDQAVNPDDETVATDKQYTLEITGTTAGADTITVMGVEIAITRRI